MMNKAIYIKETTLIRFVLLLTLTMQTTFIYALACPDSGIIRYIGKADFPNTRFTNHLSEARKEGVKSHKLHWLRGLLASGKKPTLVIMEEVPFEEWEAKERHYIRLHRATITNTTDGGDGCTAMRGRTHSPETREKLRLANLGKNTGKKLTPAQKLAKSKAQMGHAVAEATRAKIAATNKKTKALNGSPLTGKPLPTEWRANIAKGSIGKKMSAEACAKMSASAKARKATPEVKAAMAAAQQARRERERNNNHG